MVGDKANGICNFGLWGQKRKSEKVLRRDRGTENRIEQGVERGTKSHGRGALRGLDLLYVGEEL